MARFVRMWKVEETADEVVYLYGPTKEDTGRLYINKSTGEVDGEPIPGMSTQESWFCFGMLAKSKAEQLFRAREYPDETFKLT